MKRRLILSVLYSLTYWIPSSLVLYDIISGDGIVFSEWTDMFLLPGYFLGFALGFVGGSWAAVLGQIITLLIMTAIIFGLLSVKKNSKNLHSSKSSL